MARKVLEITEEGILKLVELRLDSADEYNPIALLLGYLKDIGLENEEAFVEGLSSYEKQVLPHCIKKGWIKRY